jgi:hypothetical protein
MPHGSPLGLRCTSPLDILPLLIPSSILPHVNNVTSQRKNAFSRLGILKSRGSFSCFRTQLIEVLGLWTPSQIADADRTHQALELACVISGEVTAGQGTAGDVTAGDFTAGDVTAGNFTAGDVTARNFTAGDVTAGNFTAGDVTAGNFTTGNYTAGDVTAGNFAAGDVTAGNFTAGDVTAGEITGGAEVSTTFDFEGEYWGNYLGLGLEGTREELSSCGGEFWWLELLQDFKDTSNNNS